ncbi:MAG: T9SS type A sorting domain-containing protein [Bacteroidales bacterium]|nr:T9SS type A sorting domain-containing protein [Bacteroidales bacterium]MDD3667423.1 T9SS type A sorting domain-containing protein [Bacteroidales bacterium]
MKQVILLCLGLIFLSSINSYAQDAVYRSDYGSAFTPKGKLKILVVCVKFKDHNVDDVNWPLNQGLPNWALNNEFLYEDTVAFNNISENDNSLSRYFYEMSKQLPVDKRFKLYGSFLPVEIENYAGKSSWQGLVSLAVEKMKNIPNIDSILSTFDNRKSSIWVRDNSEDIEGDGYVDYVIFNFRYSNTWNESQVPIQGINDWDGSGGGIAEVSGKIGNINLSNGFIAASCISKQIKTYTHEFGHNVYNAPHYGTVNGVSYSGTGENFYHLQATKFWGLMSCNTNEIFGCANAWESYLLGWNDIKYDLNDFSNDTIIVLKDYMSSGEAIRIRVPYFSYNYLTGQEYQYIWIENHQGINKFDQRLDFVSDLCGTPLPPSPTGLMIYSEYILNDRLTTSQTITERGGCGLYLYDRGGRFDFNVLNVDSTNSAYCWNKIYNFNKGEENPYSGYSLSSVYHNDKDNNGEINWEEFDDFVELDGNVIYGNYASNSAFRVGDSIGIGTNPPIMTFQRFWKGISIQPQLYQKLHPMYLNGISIKVLSQDSLGNMTVRIRFHDYNFNNDIRMCGDIVFPPDTININANITIDKSGTTNRMTKYNGEFINPSIITTAKNSYLRVKENKNIIIQKESVFVLDSNATIELNENSRIIVDSSATLIIKPNTNLILNGNSKIDVKNGAFICIAKDANIDLGNGGIINFYPNASLGVNSYATYRRYNNGCLSTLDSIPNIGCGAIIDNVITETHGNETWTTPKILGDDFIVKSGHTLTIQNTTISLTPKVKIKVEPNAKLIIDNSTLTSYVDVNCEGDFWGGIEIYGNNNQSQLVQYQGYLGLKNNSIIENARNAVSLWKSDDWNSMGGIVNASNTTFRNNIRSVEFMSYKNINTNNEEIDNVSKFTNCTFEWNENIYSNDKLRLDHVTLWDVKGVKFIACDFKNTLTNNNEVSKQGIYSEEAGFTVQGKIIPIPTGIEIDRSEFINLTYGIRAENISHSKNFNVQTSYFEDNFCGIFSVASNNITIKNNLFRIKPIHKPQGDFPDYAAFGVAVHGCSRYQIQENDFIGLNSDHPYKIGVQVKSSGEGANRISDNNFTNLFQASQAIGNNRGISNMPSTGLKYMCNNFIESNYGIVVTPNNSIKNGIAINQDGGDISLSAENVFAQNTSILGSDIFNDNTSVINYYSTQIGNKKPLAITSLVYNYLANSTNGVCLKNYDLWDNVTLSNAFVALENDYISLLYSYNNLLDGGSKDALLDKIQGTWTDEVWAMREEFISKSPYLSPDVLIELAKSQKLPIPIYLEIALSNPEATQKDEYVDFMKNDESDVLLTANGKEMIRDSWDTKTFRTSIESNISSKLSDMEYIKREQIYKTINDSLGFNASEYRYLLNNIRNIDAKYELVDSYIETKEYTNARNLLNSLLSSPDNEKYNGETINDYLTLIEIMESRDTATNLLPIDERMETLSESITRVGYKAKAYLNFYNPSTNYHPDYIIINPKTKGKEIKSNILINLFEDNVTLAPNPAKDYITITYNLPPKQVYTIKIYDNKGVELLTKTLNNNKGVQTINLQDFKSGSYFYIITNGKESIKSDKLIIL